MATRQKGQGETTPDRGCGKLRSSPGVPHKIKITKRTHFRNFKMPVNIMLEKTNPFWSPRQQVGAPISRLARPGVWWPSTRTFSGFLPFFPVFTDHFFLARGISDALTPHFPPSHLMTNPAESRPLQFHPNVLLTPPHRFTIVRTNRWNLRACSAPQPARFRLNANN